MFLKVVPMTDVTQILSQIEEGDPSAAEQLLPLIYDELRKLAVAKLANEKPGQTLQATALVHEAYLRLIGVDQSRAWNGRGHFFGAAAEAMRRIVVENSRRKRSQKHGGQMQRADLDVDLVVIEAPGDDLLALDEALADLESRWPEKAKLVKLRYFAGFTIPEASRALKISTATAERHWRFSRAWLYSQLHASE